MAVTFTHSAPFFMVRDVERTMNWYRDMLGFEPQTVMRAHGEGQDDELEDDHEHTGPITFVISRRDGIEVFLGASDDPPKSNGLDSFDIYLRVDAVKELYEACLAQGATMARPLERMFYGIDEFTIVDCDGRLLSIGGA